jgi:peroxiredoxin
VFCRLHAVQLHRDREKFEDAGVNLVVIGQGEPEAGARFARQHGLDGLTLLVDTRRESYKAAGAKKATFNELLGPVVVAKGMIRGLLGRKVQGRIDGHPSQLGGVLVVDTSGEVVYAHLAEDASDNPPNSEVLDAARRASGAG